MKSEKLEILKKIFSNSTDYPFDGTQLISDFETFIKKVLSEADTLYSEEHFYRDYPDFNDFLYTHHVDSIAYGVYEGDYD